MKKIIPIDKIIYNQIQPHINFNENQLEKAKESLNKNIFVKENNDKYELIFGVKYFEALKNEEEIEVNILNFDEKNSFNKLNFKDMSLIEEAILYLTMMNDMNITQEELALKLKKSQSTIANKIRLLKLPQMVQDALVNNIITERHGRCLLKLEEENIIRAFNYILDNNLNVKSSEEYVLKVLSNKKKSKNYITKGFTRNTQIAINSINQCIDMIKKLGIDVDDEVNEYDNEIVFKITLGK